MNSHALLFYCSDIARVFITSGLVDQLHKQIFGEAATSHLPLEKDKGLLLRGEGTLVYWEQTAIFQITQQAEGKLKRN